MAYKDLREWLEQIDRTGDLIRLDGVHWDLEVAAACNLTRKMVLFDNFLGYPRGYRLLGTPQYTSPALPGENPSRFFLTTNWSTEARGIALTKAWLGRLREFKPVPPKWVSGGPIQENVLKGKDIDLLKFPVPRRHEGDGGRYIGTGHIVITKDPDDSRINLGTYRMQVHNKSSTGIHISEGKDGRIILEKYHRQGKPCPMVAVVGVDAGLFMASACYLPHADGASELEFAGWLKGQPEEVFAGEFTGLPIPANAEIALEGEIAPGDTKPEGPFSEWTGYSQVRDSPVFRVKVIYHRNEPILTASLRGEVRPPGREQEGLPETRWDFTHSALIWNQLEKAGVRGIQGVVSYYRQRLIVVSIKNLYAGHSRQVGLVASQCHQGAWGGAYVVVVDHDIDPLNIQDVLYAVAMRTEPKRAVQVLDYCYASHLTMQDPSLVQKAEYAMRPEKATYMSRVIIDACRPLEWDPSWHQEYRFNPEVRRRVKEKWGDILLAEGGAVATTARES